MNFGFLSENAVGSTIVAQLINDVQFHFPTFLLSPKCIFSKCFLHTNLNEPVIYDVYYNLTHFKYRNLFAYMHSIGFHIFPELVNSQCYPTNTNQLKVMKNKNEKLIRRDIHGRSNISNNLRSIGA
mgnify:CR=1 FL=1